MNEPIYLDHAAATPLRPEAELAMREAAASFGNPSSAHRWGRAARSELERAREEIASRLDASPDEVRFVRGGTESVNLAVLGSARAAMMERGRAIVYRSAIEHSSVRTAGEEAVREGCDVRVLGVSTGGAVELPGSDALRSGDIALVTVQAANQETGLLPMLEPLVEACRDHGIPLHIDASQSFGKIALSWRELRASLLSVSAHKVGGPRGLGALVVRRGTPLHPLIFGGSQEQGVRPGTEDVAGAAGFAAAADTAVGELAAEAGRLALLRDRLQRHLEDSLPDLIVHGSEGRRAPHILNVGLRGIPRDVLIAALDLEGVGASAGSACQSGAHRVSWVLRALYGASAAEVTPLRLSVGWTTTREEVDRAADIVARVVDRALAPGRVAAQP